MCGSVGKAIDDLATDPLHPTRGTKQVLEATGIKKKRVVTDPAAERAAAEAESTQEANSRIALQRKAMRENSLLTGGGAAGGLSSTGGGRTSLGV